ncbi:unnamed protein product [Prunus brigantina]
MAHTTGTPVASPTFFADPSLRKLENSFLLGPRLVYSRFTPFVQDKEPNPCRLCLLWFL